MNLLASILSETWTQRLGWVLIHFLWEGTIIALVLAALLRLSTKASSHTRYALAAISLLFCAIAPVITWLALAPHEMESCSVIAMSPANPSQSQAAISSPPIALPTNLQAPVEIAMPWQVRLIQAANVSSPYAVGLWLLGVLILSTRLMVGWILMKRLCRSSIPVRDALCLEKFEGLLRRMQISRPVRLLESALVEVPMLIGWLRPTILVPVSLFTGMTPDQLEAIFTHELAHVRRHDYLVNLLQTVIETILFYHPAIWWISRKLREERENCCDDIALAVMQDRLVYVSALAQLEEGRGTSLALSASGGSLLQRINRIVDAKERKTSEWPLWVLIIGALSIACLTKSKAAQTPVKPQAVKFDFNLVQVDEKAYEEQRQAMDEAVKKGDLSFFYHKENIVYRRETNLWLLRDQSGWYSEGEIQSYVASVSYEKKAGKLYADLQPDKIFLGLMGAFAWSKDGAALDTTWQLTEPVGDNKLPLSGKIFGLQNSPLVQFHVTSFTDKGWNMEPGKEHAYWIGQTVGYLKQLGRGRFDETVKSPSRLAVFITAQPVAASNTNGNADSVSKSAAKTNLSDPKVQMSPADPEARIVHDLKVSDMPLTELAQKLTMLTKANDPDGLGVNIDVKVPPGEAPLKITYGYPPYTGDLFNLFYHLANLYPLRFELQSMSRDPNSQEAPITITQLPAAEALFNKKAGQTKIDLDFKDTDLGAALKSVQSSAAAKGFSFELNTDALTGQSTPVTLNAKSWSVQHAILCLCYLADLVPRPLENFNGYRLVPGSVEELHDLTSIQFGIATAVFKANDPKADSRLLASLTTPSGEKRVWGPSEVSPAYPTMYRGKEVTPSGGEIGSTCFYHHKDGDPPGYVVPNNGAPALDVKFQTTVVDKAHIHASITVFVKKPDGTTLRQLTGQWAAASGTIINLVHGGAPLVVDTPDDPSSKSNLHIFLQAGYVDSGRRETDIEPQQLELVSPANTIQQVELTDMPVKDDPGSTPDASTSKTNAAR